MRGIFVTGTDTGVGKSVVTGLLAKYLRKKGFKVITQKWIQTGSKITTDINLHLKIMGLSKDAVREQLGLVCPYIFKFPASPHLAARAEKRRIDLARIKESFTLLSSQFDFVIVEGIGGTLVPVNEKHLVIDIARELNLPVLVVAQNKLGAINQTLMTVEALKMRKMKILGILFNNRRGQDGLILKDNQNIIRRITGEKMLGALSWSKDLNLLYRQFLPAARKIIR